MKSPAIILAAAALSFLLGGCSDPRLDTSSDEAKTESMKKVMASLDGNQAEQFSEALRIVMFNGMNIGDLVASPDAAAARAKSSVHGLTAKEVIAKAEQIKTERAAQQRAQALNEIAELEAKKAGAEQAREALKKFVVHKSRFQQRDEGNKYTTRIVPIIEIEVENATGSPVSRAYFRGTIASPGRAVPWLVKDFNFEFSGGIESGERDSWTLKPNQFSEWGRVSPPGDALFTVDVVRLDGADGKPLYNGEFSDKEQARLDTLKASVR